MIKYLVFGGTITSKNDGDEHFIGAGRLAELYKVKPNECIYHNPNGTPEATNSYREFLKRQYPKAIILKPRYDGNYDIGATNDQRR